MNPTCSLRVHVYDIYIRKRESVCVCVCVCVCVNAAQMLVRARTHTHTFTQTHRHTNTNVCVWEQMRHPTYAPCVYASLARNNCTAKLYTRTCLGDTQTHAHTCTHTRAGARTHARTRACAHTRSVSACTHNQTRARIPTRTCMHVLGTCKHALHVRAQFALLVRVCLRQQRHLPISPRTQLQHTHSHTHTHTHTHTHLAASCAGHRDCALVRVCARGYQLLARLIFELERHILRALFCHELARPHHDLARRRVKKFAHVAFRRRLCTRRCEKALF